MEKCSHSAPPTSATCDNDSGAESSKCQTMSLTWNFGFYLNDFNFTQRLHTIPYQFVTGTPQLSTVMYSFCVVYCLDSKVCFAINQHNTPFYVF
jgi:hypothetical protein